MNTWNWAGKWQGVAMAATVLVVAMVVAFLVLLLGVLLAGRVPGSPLERPWPGRLPHPRRFTLRPFTFRRYALAGLAAAAVGVYLLGVLVLIVRPMALTFGTTTAERSAALPGDELIPAPRQGYTQAISIAAPVDQVWPWLVQVGYRRAGWYNVDAINRLAAPDYFFEGNASATRIIPELQTVASGTTIDLAPGLSLTVVAVDPPHTLLLVADPSARAGEMNVVWCYRLIATGPASTRLITRFRTVFPGGVGAGLGFGIVNEIGGALIQQPAMLHGIKVRAEAAYRAVARL